MKKLQIVKIGGNIIDNPELLNGCLYAFKNLEGHKILVHGGGKAGSKMLKALNIPVRYNEGRRITDLESLRVVTMVYAGEVNKKVVAELQAVGCNAIGLSGCDGNIIEAEKRKVKDIDYGYAGDIISVNTNVLRGFLSLGLVPVINPITHNGSGLLLNTNADTIAATIGEAFSELYSVYIHYCFEMNGVLQNVENPNSVIPEINEDLFYKMKNQGSISSGMIPKLTNAFTGLHKGVHSITIGNHHHFSGGIAHTKIIL